jgi:uncharacterized protein YprB with RNaseH-like and TPR domain/predicted nuclease with RNAse H fold/dephospho-CoA kinase
MLRHTFQHLPGIASVREQKLWESGIVNWDHLEARQPPQLQLFEIDRFRKTPPIESSRRALENKNAEFFEERLPSSERFRIASTFPQRVLFVDIETTGLSLYYDEITLVGWDLKGNYHVAVQGRRDSQDRMYSAFEKASVIVTFNGSLFDLPFLEQEFPDLPIPECHLDLRFASKQVGFTGGQKAIEEELSIQRPGYLQSMGGETAPVLWHDYRWGDTSALKRLVRYNQADIEGMKGILDEVINHRAEEIGGPIAECPRPRFSRKSEGTTGFLFHDTVGRANIEIKSYSGERGPKVQYADLGLSSDLRIVGIDLTGDEERASGWGLLEGKKASTKRLHSDEELIQSTLDAEPSLVSIDSPLSLPKGRNGVEDSDPAREEHGIMRECERVLKKRGINVYPCLIRSMQQLTARGIKLAAQLRAHGIPVIESYPGAAQDILRIPRKQAGLNHLRNGIQRFGLEGKFGEEKVSHDELDAITSGVVGLFFWSGYFERLGNEEEDYLIIPEVGESKSKWRGRTTIGLSGPISAGKTTAARTIEEEGFSYGRYSQVVRKRTKERGLEPTQENLQRVGEEINEEQGQRWLGKQLLQLIGSASRIVIDGMRHPEDHAFLVERFGPRFSHITIKAGRDVRKERFISEEGGTEKEFYEADNHPVERNIPRLQKLAHHTVRNEVSLGDFKAEIRSLKSRIESRETVCQ